MRPLAWVFLLLAAATCGRRSTVHITDGAANDGPRADLAADATPANDAPGPDVAADARVANDGPGPVDGPPGQPDGAGDGPPPRDSSPREANQILSCALPGQQCYGVACCQGAGTCDETPYMGNVTWTCGGMVAGGNDETCLAPPAPGCHWTELSGCGGYGPIDSFCPAGESARQLRRCSGTCFAPDRLYQQYPLCACDSGPGPGRPACCQGTTWQAVLCCTARP